MWDFEEPAYDQPEGNGNGEARKPIEWAVFAPSLNDRSRLSASKRNRSRRSRERRDANRQATEPATDLASEGTCELPTDCRGNLLTLGVHDRRSGVGKLEPENDEGNVEYKLRLKQNNPIRFQQLVTQLQFRLSEGNGTCFYYIGVEDDGYLRGLGEEDMEASLQVLRAMINKCDASLVSQKELAASNDHLCVVAEISRSCIEELPYADICVAVAGAEGSGKSTLVAVLSNGQNGRPLLDNGQGSARMLTLKHKHEIESGKTSSLGHYSVAYAREDRVLNYAGINPLLPSEIAKAACSIVRMVDLGGSSKYLKTAFYGLTGLLPAVALLCICPLVGFQPVTKQHLAVALALGINIAVVVSKVDLVDESKIASLMEEVSQIFTLAAECSGGFEIMAINSEQEAHQAATHRDADKTLPVPVFQVSTTSGEGLSVLHGYLSHLAGPRRQDESSTEKATEQSSAQSAAHFIVDDIFPIKEVGQVAAGTLVKGCIELNEELLLGPSATAAFTPVIVKSIERAQVPVRRLRAGQVGTILYESTEVDEQSSARLRTVSMGSSLAKPEILPVSCTKDFEGMELSPPEETANCGASSPLEMRIKSDRHNPTRVLQDTTSVLGRRGIPSIGETDRRHDDWQSTRPHAVAPEGQRPIKNPVTAEPFLETEHVQNTSSVNSVAQSTQLQQTAILEAQEAYESQPASVQPTDMLNASSIHSGRTPSSYRKGTVLVNSSLMPKATWEFEAVMVLFDGFWPPRGLISGSWPTFPDSDSESGSQSKMSGSLKSRSFKSSHRPIYTPVVHCKNVRQAARVTSMHEHALSDHFSTDDVKQATGVDLSCAISAALCLQSSEVGERDICVATVKFRFEHEPAWLEVGSRMIVRDRTESSLSGAGVITQLCSV